MIILPSLQQNLGFKRTSGQTHISLQWSPDLTLLSVFPVQLILPRQWWFKVQFHDQFKLNEVCAATERVKPARLPLQLTDTSHPYTCSSACVATGSWARELCSSLLGWFFLPSSDSLFDIFFETSGLDMGFFKQAITRAGFKRQLFFFLPLWCLGM